MIVGGGEGGVVEQQSVQPLLIEFTGQGGVHDAFRRVPGGALGVE